MKVPRTPVYWPRMKVRGRRNKAKLALRVHYAYVYPVVVETAGNPMTFKVVPVEDATHYLKTETVVDGFGRRVARNPKPKLDRKRTLSFTVDGAYPRLEDLLFGKDRP